VAALCAAQLLTPFLFGIASRDPWTLAGVVAVSAATTLLAGYVPGRRAASIEPVRVLRSD
jgi:putative ABC transport system permease protein